MQEGLRIKGTFLFLLFCLPISACKEIAVPNFTEIEAEATKEPAQRAIDEQPPTQEEQPSSNMPIGLPDIVTESGIFVYWESDIDIERASPNRDKIEQWWIEIQQCSQLTVDEPPVIRVVNDIYEYCGFMRSSGAFAGLCDGIIYMPAAGLNSRRTVKHEALHYLLAKNDLPYVDHEPAYLWQCEWN